MCFTGAFTSSAEKIQLPCPFKWPVRLANFKRCLLLSRIPIKDSDKELVIINLVISAVMYVLLFISIATVPRLQSDRTLYLVVSSMILLNAVGMEWMYKGLEEYTFITIRSVIFKAVSTCFHDPCLMPSSSADRSIF